MFERSATRSRVSIPNFCRYPRLKIRIGVSDVVALVQSSQFMLIETLAQHLVLSFLDDQQIHRLRVEVEKPGVLRLADSVSAALTQQRRD